MRPSVRLSSSTSLVLALACLPELPELSDTGASNTAPLIEGVIITPAGLLTDDVATAEVVASDPEGARAELHIPVTVNAAREEVLGTRTTTTVRRRRDMTDEEYEKLNIDALDRVMDMSEEEFERHTRDQEERDQKD